MKQTFTFFIIFFLTYSFNYAQNEQTSQNQGIQFFQGTWDELLADAKARKKPFFVDVYTTWCAPCKMMTKLTFTDSEVGKLSKLYYLAYKIDAERGDGVTVAEKYRVKSYPTVLFFNAEGKLVGRETGYMDKEHFLYVLEKYLKKLY
jgi:thioredoxin 1